MADFDVRFRFLNAQCFEFELPDGTHIVTDPYITPTKGLAKAGYMEFSVEEIEKCDYIILTHSHWDHTSDIKYLCDKFNARLFAGHMIIQDLAKILEIEPNLLIPVLNGQSIEIGGFKLTAYSGDHIVFRGKKPDGAGKGQYLGPEGYGWLHQMGFVENYNYCLTIANNFRIMFFAGTDENKVIWDQLKDFRPNMLMRQFVGSYGVEWNAEIIAKANVPITVPMHHEATMAGVFGKSMQEMTDELNAILYEKKSDSKFIVPEPYKWYTVKTTVE